MMSLPSEQWLSVETFAQQIRISVGAADKMLDRGTIPFFSFGGVRAIPAAWFDWCDPAVATPLLAPPEAMGAGDVYRVILEDAVLAEDRAKAGFVYFVRAQDLVKIGRATDWKARVRSIRTANPHAVAEWVIRTEDMRALEAEAHRHFAEHRRSGEGFHLPPGIWRETATPFLRRHRAKRPGPNA